MIKYYFLGGGGRVKEGILALPLHICSR